ncbi:MAG: cupin domain-containing protein [Gemmatimonadaceae bacterium]
MQISNSFEIAGRAVSANPDRASTAILYDSDDARVVVFRIDAGQSVPLHSSDSTVLLTVVSGSGFVSGPVDGVVSEQRVTAGIVATYSPGEMHGMRADSGDLVIVATIAPRPGTTRAAQVA